MVSGLFDHTSGTEVVDSDFSLEPARCAEMGQAVRKTEKAFGEVCYQTTGKERESELLPRFLFAIKSVEEGESFGKRCQIHMPA